MSAITFLQTRNSDCFTHTQCQQMEYQLSEDLHWDGTYHSSLGSNEYHLWWPDINFNEGLGPVKCSLMDRPELTTCHTGIQIYSLINYTEL